MRDTSEKRRSAEQGSCGRVGTRAASRGPGHPSTCDERKNNKKKRNNTFVLTSGDVSRLVTVTRLALHPREQGPRRGCAPTTSRTTSCSRKRRARTCTRTSGRSRCRKAVDRHKPGCLDQKRRLMFSVFHRSHIVRVYQHPYFKKKNLVKNLHIIFPRPSNSRPCTFLCACRFWHSRRISFVFTSNANCVLQLVLRLVLLVLVSIPRCLLDVASVSDVKTRQLNASTSWTFSFHR